MPMRLFERAQDIAEFRDVFWGKVSAESTDKESVKKTKEYILAQYY